MEDLTKAILNLLRERGIAGEGIAGAGLQDHSVYGEPVQMGMGKAASEKPKVKRVRKKKVVVVAESEAVPEPVAELAKELVAAGKAGGRKKRVVSAEGKAKRKASAAGNPWLQHLSAFRKAHPEMKPIEVAKEAKKTYVKK